MRPIPRVLYRSLMLDVGAHTLVCVMILLFVLVVGAVLQKIDTLIAAGVSLEVVLRLMGLLVPMYLMHALPCAFLVGVLMSVGRMSSDSEIVALRSLGVSLGEMLAPIGLVGIGVTALGLLTTCELEPRSYYRMQAMLQAALSASSIVEPGHVRALGQGQSIYVKTLSKSDDCPLESVVLSDFSDKGRPFYVVARCGLLDTSARLGSTGLALEMLDGSIHFSDSHAGSYRRMIFDHATTQLDLSRTLLQGRRLRHHSMRELVDGSARQLFDSRDITIEVHRRLALPFAALLFGVVALPLAVRSPRGGRAWGSLVAGGVAAIYWCTFTAGRTVSEAGWLPPAVGIWLADVLLLLVGVSLLAGTRTCAD